jgi:ankyrin repeat protein
VLLAAGATLRAADARLADAAKRQNAPLVRTLLQQGADTNAPQADGATALHWAVYWNDFDTVDLLLRAGAKANVLNEFGIAPLSLACTNASAPLVDRLLRGGADPNLKGARVPALMECARTGNIDTVKTLLAHKADVTAREPVRDQTALMWAVAEEHPDIVRALIDAGADVQARSRVTRAFVNRANPNDVLAAAVGEVSQGGSTPLLFAARVGDVASAELLLAAGAHVNDIAPDGTSALTLAVHSGHGPLARLLLERGANPNIIGSGYTALHAAVLRGDMEMVQALLVKGAVIDSRLRHGTTTIRASRNYFLADSLTGATPLLLAAKFLELDIMRALIARRADPTARLQDGTTLLMLAAGAGSQTRLFDRRERMALLKDSDEPAALAAVNIALDVGADVNAVNNDGDTALHAAAKMNYPTVVTRLITRGARVDALNQKKETPLAVASGDDVKAELRKGR